MQNYFSENPDAPVYIAQLKTGANSKALQSGVSVARKLNKPVYLFARESGEGKAKTLYGNYVPKAELDRGLDAVSWNKTVSDKLQGRGGGKPDGAQGQGEARLADGDEAVALATAYYRAKLEILGATRYRRSSDHPLEYQGQYHLCSHDETNDRPTDRSAHGQIAMETLRGTELRRIQRWLRDTF